MTSRLTISELSGGFTLVEVLMVIAILGVITVMSILPLSNSIDEGRFQDTVSRMKAIRDAMLGDPTLTANGVRTSFGYVGDVGAIPTAMQGLAALMVNPGIAAWAVNQSVRFGLGWNGPYLTSAQAGTNFSLDGWGRALIYDPSASPPTLTSYGADGVVGGAGLNSDIVVQLPANLQLAVVYGFISNSASPYSGNATVEINYPDGSGALTTQTANLVPANKGYFTFSNVPLGKRSVTAYLPSKAAPTQTIGPVLISVDSANYVIAANALDTNSMGGGACNNVGVVTLAGGVSLSGGNQTLNFQVNVSTNVNLVQMSVANGNATTWSSATIVGNPASCSGAISLYPCPVTDDGTLSTLTPNVAISAGTNLAVSVVFAASMSGSGTATLQFMHNLGCDQVVINGL